MALTDRDYETLGELIAGYDSMLKYGRDGVAPIDFGGGNGSHHSKTATKLVSHGMAEHRKRGFEWGKAPAHYRGSKVYRPTQAGRDAHDAWWKAQREARA